jgi:hypothetical protein
MGRAVKNRRHDARDGLLDADQLGRVIGGFDGADRLADRFGFLKAQFHGEIFFAFG